MGGCAPATTTTTSSCTNPRGCAPATSSITTSPITPCDNPRGCSPAITPSVTSTNPTTSTEIVLQTPSSSTSKVPAWLNQEQLYDDQKELLEIGQGCRTSQNN